MARESSPARLRSQTRIVHQHDPARVVTLDQRIAAALPRQDRRRIIENAQHRARVEAFRAIHIAATRTT